MKNDHKQTYVRPLIEVYSLSPSHTLLAVSQRVLGGHDLTDLADNNTTTLGGGNGHVSVGVDTYVEGSMSAGAPAAATASGIPDAYSVGALSLLSVTSALGLDAAPRDENRIYKGVTARGYDVRVSFHGTYSIDSICDEGDADLSL